jgi:hypothetical protein
MTRKNIIIGNNIYKTQKDCETDVRNKLIEIGIGNSVKDKSIDIYNFFINLCKRHPHQDEKLKNIVDFEVKQDALNKKGIALNIVNNDGKITEISWRICITGKGHTPHQSYNMALRYTISSQIQSYKEKEDTNISICSICKDSLKNKMFHIDHEIHFAKLVDDFTNLHNITIPIEYEKIPITFERTFTTNDKWIGNLFYDYHLENAKLRVSCEKCNLSREKYKK